MAIQIGGTTVIDNSRTLQNVGGLKTVGGVSILGSGDIAAGGGTEIIDVTASNFTNASNINTLNGGTNGVWGWTNWSGSPWSGNYSGSVTVTVNGTNSWIVKTTGDGHSFGPGGTGVGVGRTNGPALINYGKAFFKLDPGANLVESTAYANGYTNVVYTTI